jgi:trimeric autotransporter adhesin
MSAIRAAFERHEIHCTIPAVIDSGCAGGPAAAPVVTATPIAGGTDLSWTPVAGAATYAVYRTEGVNGCDYGKAKIGETGATSFSDSGLLDGRAYFYGVLPVGGNSSCFGLMSACAAVVPLLPTDPCVPVELQDFVVQ